MEDSKLTNRLTLAVYLFLAALAVILALVGIKYFQNDSPTRDLILNLSTEILGVVIIFFIVNQLFLLNKERDIVKHFESLKKGIELKFSPLKLSSKIKDESNLEDWFGKAESIYILGYNNAKLLQALRGTLIKFLKSKEEKILQIIIVDPDSPAGELFKSNSSRDDSVLGGFINALKYISDIKKEVKKDKNAKGKMEIGLLTWIPSCHLIITSCEDNSGIAKAKIYSPMLSQPVEDRYNFLIIFKQKEHPMEYNYCKDNFQLLWKGKTTKILDDNSFEKLKSKYNIEPK